MKFKNLAIFTFLGLIGCTAPNNQDFVYFDSQVRLLLKKEKEIVAPISKLTLFDWHKVCISDGKKNKLAFYNGSNVREIILPKEHYYISQNNVKGSPRGNCYKNIETFRFVKIETSESDLIKINEVKNKEH